MQTPRFSILYCLDGQVANSFEQQQRIWFDQFSQAEAANQVSIEGLQASHHTMCGSQEVVRLEDLPTFAAVQWKI